MESSNDKAKSPAHIRNIDLSRSAQPKVTACLREREPNNRHESASQ